jgi:hypothetical protein
MDWRQNRQYFAALSTVTPALCRDALSLTG